MLVSIIIPCYNVEKYIEDCLTSVVRQTYHLLEIIVIDNQSTDQTISVVKHFKQNSNIDITILSEIQRGAPAARNKGLYYAKGEWVQFLDADDLLMPTKIEKQLQLIKNQNISFIAGAFERFFLDNKKEKQKLWIRVHPLIALMQGRGVLGITSANLWNRQILLAINGWNENQKSNQEYELMFRMLQKNEHVLYDHQIRTSIRQRPSGQISQQDPKTNYQHSLKLRVIILIFIRIHKNDLFLKNQSLFFQLFISHLRMLSGYDYQHACTLLEEHWPERMTLHSSKENPRIQVWYALLFNIFGFRNLEYLKKRIRKY